MYKKTLRNVRKESTNEELHKVKKVIHRTGEI